MNCTSMGKRLEGKVAIVTGGASGFGEAASHLFVQHGAKVIIADVQDEKGIYICNKIMESLMCNNHSNGNDQGEIISYVHCDVSNENDMKNLFDLVIIKHKKLDIMYNNARIIGDLNHTMLDTTSENFKRVFNVNVYSGFLGAKHAAKLMIPRKSGVILFTANLASLIGGEAPHAYTMSMHAIIGLMKNLSVEMGQHGIRVNAISPGGVPTSLLSKNFGIDKDIIDRVLSENAVLKGVSPVTKDVAHVALFLASDEARFVSGLNFTIDGGYGITNPSFSMALKELLPLS